MDMLRDAHFPCLIHHPIMHHSPHTGIPEPSPDDNQSMPYSLTRREQLNEMDLVNLPNLKNYDGPSSFVRAFGPETRFIDSAVLLWYSDDFDMEGPLLHLGSLSSLSSISAVSACTGFQPAAVMESLARHFPNVRTVKFRRVASGAGPISRVRSTFLHHVPRVPPVSVDQWYKTYPNVSGASMASSSALPLDLLRLIVSHITEKEHLLTLCRVSKTFLREAQPLLFTDVTLASPFVAVFCRTLAALPALALRVQRLAIQLANDFPEAGMDRLGRMLQSLKNLGELEITPLQPIAWADMLVRTRESMLQPWTHVDAAYVLLGCPFRLRLFSSGFRISHPAFLGFLNVQDKLEELRSFDTTGRTFDAAGEDVASIAEVQERGAEVGVRGSGEDTKETCAAAGADGRDDSDRNGL
ncbi:hypothetical protein C8R45DRAFT_1221752 [Mycena sanguinolenta]|nr:hypothetical protein C8R45DRAFT_1221752 [Mycena sanguinolenta]